MKRLLFKHQTWEDLIFLILCILYLCNLFWFLKNNPCLKTARWKWEGKKNCVLVKCPPRSGETTNTKCLFASIFLNVNCEREGVKRDRRSLRLSESHPQSYCSLAKSDAKHSLKPIYVFVQPQRNESCRPQVLVTLVSLLCSCLCVVFFLRVTKGIV